MERVIEFLQTIVSTSVSYVRSIVMLLERSDWSIDEKNTFLTKETLIQLKSILATMDIEYRVHSLSKYVWIEGGRGHLWFISCVHLLFSAAFSFVLRRMQRKEGWEILNSFLMTPKKQQMQDLRIYCVVLHRADITSV